MRLAINIRLKQESPKCLTLGLSILQGMIMENTFANLFETILGGLGADFFAKSANIIQAVAPLFSIGFGIYITIVALNTYNKGLDENAVELGQRVAGWLIIIACAFNAQQYNTIAQALYSLPEFLSESVNGQPYSGNVLDEEVTKLVKSLGDIHGAAMKKLDWNDFGEKMAVSITFLFAIVLAYVYFSVVAAFYLVAKISLAMVILVGPIFVGAMLFPATRQWGMNWIGQIFAYGIMVMFYVIIGAVQMTFYQKNMQLSMDVFDSTKPFSVVAMFPVIGMFFLATLVFLVVAWNVPSIANALTGGAGITGFAGVARGTDASVKGLARGGQMGVSLGKSLATAPYRAIQWGRSKLGNSAKRV